MVSQEIEQQLTVSPEEAAEIAEEVQELIEAGEEQLAWERVRHLHPADIGIIVASLPCTSRDTIVRVMSPETVAWILRQMNPIEAGRLGTRLGSRMLSLTLGQIHPQEALETLRRLPLRRAKEVAATLEQPLAGTEFLAHAEDTAATLMATRFPAVRIEDEAEAARESLRVLEDIGHKCTQIFVVEEGDLLAGQINMLDLELAHDDTPVRAMMEPVVAAVTVETPTQECARLQRHYNLTQIPVVHDRQLIGALLAESLLSAVVEEGTRQMLQVASVAGETVDGPLFASIRTRLPWLTVNLGTTFLAAATVALFQSTLAQVIVLAAFLPVVAGQGGIGGTQTLTLIVSTTAAVGLLECGKVLKSQCPATANVSALNETKRDLRSKVPS